MKSLNYSTLRSIFALVLGILLVAWPDVAINYLVITIGALFLAAGLIAVINYFARRDKEGASRRFPIEGAGSLLFGIWLMTTPGFFVSILMYVLGIILILGALQQLFALMAARKWTKVPMYFYLVPVLILIAGIVVMVNPFQVASAAFILLGITCIVYAVSELFGDYRFRKRIDQ